MVGDRDQGVRGLPMLVLISVLLIALLAVSLSYQSPPSRQASGVSIITPGSPVPSAPLPSQNRASVIPTSLPPAPAAIDYSAARTKYLVVNATGAS